MSMPEGRTAPPAIPEHADGSWAREVVDGLESKLAGDPAPADELDADDRVPDVPGSEEPPD